MVLLLIFAIALSFKGGHNVLSPEVQERLGIVLISG
jgi:hypothetical protein